MKKLLLTHLILWICLFSLYADQQQKMTVYIFDRPPYYTTQEGTAGGFLVEITKIILENANIPYHFEYLPTKRIMDVLKNQEYAMSIGWLKNQEREELYSYSDPIYIEAPFFLVIKASKTKDLPTILNSDNIFSSKMTIGIIDGFYYGEWFESNIRKYAPQSVSLRPGHPDTYLNMLVADRFDYILMPAEEASWFISKNTQFMTNLVSLKIIDAPKGSMRYLLYSKGVDNKTIDKINKTIQNLKSTEKYRTIIQQALVINTPK